MMKIILILLVSIISTKCFNLGENLKLRAKFKPDLLIDILGDSLGPLQLSSVIIKSSSESDYLTQLAQDLADLPVNECPFKFINKRTESSRVIKSVITFGLKIKGNVTLEEILLNDPTCALDGMSGFLDFRYENTKLSIVSKDVREFVQAQSPGFVSFSSENLKQTVNLANLTDLSKLLEFHQPFLYSQIKTMDQTGKIIGNFDPLVIRMEMKNFKLKFSTNFNVSVKVNPSSSVDEIESILESYYRKKINVLILNGLGLLNDINKYGFGVSIDSNNVITLVYSLGIDTTSISSQKKILKEKLTGFNYELENGEKINLNPFNYEKDSIIKMRRINNKVIQSSLNHYREQRGLDAVKSGDFKMYQFAQNEANRLVASDKLKLSTLELKSFNKDLLLIDINISGTTKIKELFFGFESINNSSLLCFDNFSQEKPYNIVEISNLTHESMCSRESLDKLKSLSCFASGISYNNRGDLYSSTVMSIC